MSVVDESKDVHWGGMSTCHAGNYVQLSTGLEDVTKSRHWLTVIESYGAAT